MYSGIIGVIGGVEDALHGLGFYGGAEAREEAEGGPMKGEEREGKRGKDTGTEDTLARPTHAAEERERKKNYSITEKNKGRKLN